jgi:hypothetical protein
VRALQVVLPLARSINRHPMAQKLFSESLQEFSGKIENPQLADSIVGLKQLVGGRNLRFYQWDEHAIALAVRIPVELPPLGNVEGIDIRGREPVLIRVDLKDYPNIPPMVFPDRIDFPKNNLAHLYVAKNGKPPSLCLVKGDIAEWYSNKRLKDLFIRTSNWLRDAATGELTENGEQFDPIRLEGFAGSMIYDYDQIASVVNAKQSYEKGKNFSIALFERVSAGSGIAFKLNQLVTTDNLESSVQDLKKEHEKNDSSSSKKNYHLGYILWSDSEYPHTKYSVHFPENWNSFKEFCAGYGIAVSHIEKQIASNDQNVFVNIPVITAIRRPKKIIGFSSDIEFINFTIRIDTTDVEAGTIVNNVPVLFYKHGQPLSKEKAKQISGGQADLGKYSLVAGCGALGSKVIMHFARSGVTNYILTDPDDLSPHNMVRHALLGYSEGLGKADALKREINAIFPYEKMPMLLSAKISGSGFLEAELNKFFHWILDFTASSAFSQTLVKTSFETTPRIVKSHITDFGNLGVTYFEGKDRNPRLDDLQVMLYAQYKTDPIIVDWLQREADNSLRSNNLSVTVGVGCNSETTVLSDDIVSLHAAYTAGVIKAESKLKQSEEGKVYINQIKSEPYFTNIPKLIHIPPLDVLPSINNPSWQIRMKPGIIEEMKREMGLAMPSETGGVFVGCANYKTKTIHVTDLLKAPGDSKANEVCFFRGVLGLPDTIREINHSTGNQLGYIGEWHTHPFGPNQMSTTDAASIRKFGSEFNILPTPLPVFLMIITPTHILPYVY